jgi:hypothetical protein
MGYSNGGTGGGAAVVCDWGCDRDPLGEAPAGNREF